jgi:hypothetical protein
MHLYHGRKIMAILIPSPNENLAFYDELQKQ